VWDVLLKVQPTLLDEILKTTLFSEFTYISRCPS
jgi:hypothetical protein